MLLRRSARTAWLVLLIQSPLAWGAIEIPPLETLAPEIRSEEGTSQVADRLKEASKQFQAGKLEECFERLQSAKKTQANLPPARLMFARLFLAANRIGDARAQLEQAAASAPEYPGVYLTFGNLALAEGRLTDADVHFHKAASNTLLEVNLS